MLAATKLKLTLSSLCYWNETTSNTTFPPCLDTSKCNGHFIYKFTIAMGYLEIYGFEIKDLDIIAEDFSDFFNTTTHFHSK